MCAMLQINDVIKGTDETTETIMKSNAGRKIENFQRLRDKPDLRIALITCNKLF